MTTDTATEPAPPPAPPRRVPHDARAIANSFLDLGERDGVPIDLLKLQHLIYFAHGWHLALLGEPLVYQTVVAEPDGPAVRAVGIAFDEYLGGYVSGRAALDPDGVRTFEPVPLRADLSADSAGIVKRVWELFKEFPPDELSEIGRAEGGPWDRVVGDTGDDEVDDWPIPNAFIREHFLAQLDGRGHARR